VAAVWAIVRWHAPILGKYVSLVIAPFGGTLASFEVLVRRFRVTRFLFGMKPAPRLTDLKGHTQVTTGSAWDASDREEGAGSAANRGSRGIRT
jgi:hypothetical protein